MSNCLFISKCEKRTVSLSLFKDQTGMQTLMSTVSTNNAFKNRELKHGIVINECCSFVNIYVCVFAFLQSNAAPAPTVYDVIRFNRHSDSSPTEPVMPSSSETSSETATVNKKDNVGRPSY